MIEHKWRAGRVIFAPFGFEFESMADAVYGLVTDVLIWIPAGFLLGLSRRRQGLAAWGQVVLAATALEILQLFIFSRVSDVTDVLTAALGGAVGLIMARRSPRGGGPFVANGPAPPSRISPGWSLLLLAYVGALALVFWYPFDFRFDASAYQAGQAALKRLPFEAFYFQSEYMAATELLRSLLFFFPLGALAGFAVRIPRDPVRRKSATVSALVLIATVALAVELGQVLLPTRNPDLTDGLIQALGGAAGFLLAVLVRRLPQNSP